jgi:tetratricopeptide (TPR) repeat protein
VLLATTGLFVFNPSLTTSIFHIDQSLSAEEMPLDPSTADGLNALTGAATSPDSSINENGNNLSPKRDYTGLAPATNDTTTVKKDYAPGENPFQPANQKQVTIGPAVNIVTNPVVANPALSNTGALRLDNPTQKQAVDPEANPFADPAAKAKLDLPANENAEKTKTEVDDRALRYYAASKDLKRLGAEMRRLKMLYPDWQPPKDLFSPVANVNEQPLWDIYKTGNYAAVRARIAQMQSSNPNWRPSDDLMQKLQMSEVRSLIYRAYAQHRWQEVISTAQAASSILVCSDMQVLWDVGESFAQIRNYSQSFDVYKYILTSCDDPSLRLATVQKASLQLPSQGTASLISYGRVMADGTSEFESIGFDGIRRQIGAFIANTDMAAAPAEDDLKRFVDFVQRSGSGADAGLVGWFFYAQEDWQMANSWFIQAAQYDPSPKNIEGVILTLRNMDRPDDALKLARRYIKASPEIARQYVEIVSETLTSEKPTIALKDKQFDDFEKVVADQKSALGAQALGWKYLNDGDKAKAKDWFKQSVSWEPTEGGVVGLAVMASRAKDYRVLSALKAEYHDNYASLDDFKIYSPGKKIYKVYKPHRYRKHYSFNDAQKFAPKKKRFEFQAPG